MIRGWGGLRLKNVPASGTKHLPEVLGGKLAGVIDPGQLLQNLQQAVSVAAEQGIDWGATMCIGNWELIFSSSRGPGLFPALVHAIYRSTECQ